MKILLITFSGTKNTFICGEFLKKYLEVFGNDVSHYLYKKDVPFEYNVDDFDIIGIGYPIHGFNVPKPFYKFIKSLKKVENKMVFIYKVSGEPFAVNNSSSKILVKKLSKLGYKVILEKHFLMPYNIMFNYKDEIKKEMYLYLEQLTKAYAIQINNLDEEKIKYKLIYNLVSDIVRIEWLAGPVNCKLVKVDQRKCINCYKCIRECPTNSVYLDKKNKIKIKASCCICMKCAHDCPVDAFKFGFLNPWRVNGTFNYKKLLDDKNVDPDYINNKTEGYFKHFRKYFKAQNEYLKKYNLEIPIIYKEGEDLKYYKNK